MLKPRVHRADSRTAILDSALTALSGDPRIPLGELAERAGVGRATLHRYFKSRDELIRELALMSVREIDEAVEGLDRHATSAIHYLQLVLDAVIPLGDRFHFLANEAWLTTEPLLKQELDRQLESLVELVELCKAEGSVDQSVPSAWIVGAIDSLIYAAWSLVASGHVAQRDASKLLFETLMNGVSS